MPDAALFVRAAGWSAEPEFAPSRTQASQPDPWGPTQRERGAQVSTGLENEMIRPIRSDATGDAVARALQDSPVMVLGMDEALRYRWFVNLRAPWSEETLLGRTDLDILGEDGAYVTEAKRRVLETGRPETIDIDVEFERQRHWYEVTVRRDEDADGTRTLLCTALDVSEKKRREIMLQALLREVSHRSKNLLSMVLSIASQTSRKAFDKHTFLARFTGRIQSIAHSQDAITHSNWRGAVLRPSVTKAEAPAMLPSLSSERTI